ncbi:hypothetical protein NDU88_005502 [Pleurodeles waltl]|uniref:Uncharacterized protein n=1 Tax=Pleurodeles waltl TaxID=8319 RepID=A0AAV7VL95_PLEWA|nr:hypothetical protein NDU88_005502 [Pleurodeles waltl]
MAGRIKDPQVPILILSDSEGDDPLGTFSDKGSASGLIRDMGFEEFLDFDEGNETVAMVGGIFKDVGGQGNNQSRSFGVLQGQKKAPVQSDRRDVERIVSGSAGNLPRALRPMELGARGAPHPAASSGSNDHCTALRVLRATARE